jgi:eukaryotic-like serine/threonine-protein kinase
VVVEVEDLRSGARVAIKTLSSSRTPDPRCVRSLWREISLFPRVQVEGVVRSLAPAVGHRGTPALVMELVHGASLRELAARATFEQLATSLADLALTLDRLHREARVAHLDVKPENVLVDHQGRTLLVDFGLATELGRTPETEIAGTPPYMAPERFVPHAPDAGADQFAFGVMALELLTGEPVDALCDGGLAAYTSWVAEMSRRLDPALGPALAQACSLDPKDRWPSLSPLAPILRAARGAFRSKPPPTSARTTRHLSAFSCEPSRACRAPAPARASVRSATVVSRSALTRTSPHSGR